MKQIVGACLYYYIVTEIISIVSISTIASEQAEWYEITIEVAKICLDHLATFPNGTITYEKSEMVLWDLSDGSCLFDKKTKSRAGGHYFLSHFAKELEKGIPKINGPVQKLHKILKNIAS